MACGIAAAELFRRFSLEDSCDEEDKDDGHGQQKELEEVQARRPRGDWIVEEDDAAAGAANGKGERATRNTILSNHGLMHTPWNKCLHRGSIHSSSPFTKSSRQMAQLSTSGSGTMTATEVVDDDEEEDETTYGERGILANIAATADHFLLLSRCFNVTL
ncbi:hypothetical protein B296_00040348 [Ensete ventricosum]|uniref:Uncharacterized protein n=1 Tax=Ensete ventricosum TaxID=4639 RepID=A0A426XG94_ENSVE|nr:hypothetical protein B296_00040348 [Ensete ventricosum]